MPAACVIGWPVDHSRSPLIHNYWLKTCGVAGEYRREAVPPLPLRRADAFLYVRMAMSESGAFEVSYNVFAEPRAPMFFAVWKHAPIKTTLLRDLEEVCDVVYREFEHPEELRGDLHLHQVGQRRAADLGRGGGSAAGGGRGDLPCSRRGDLRGGRRGDLGGGGR